MTAAGYLESARAKVVIMDNLQRFECQCSSFHHSIRFSLDLDGDLFVCVALNTLLPWWKRLWRAVVYVFHPGHSPYGEYDEIILRREDYKRLRELLSTSESLFDKSIDTASQ